MRGLDNMSTPWQDETHWGNKGVNNSHKDLVESIQMRITGGGHPALLLHLQALLAHGLL